MFKKSLIVGAAFTALSMPAVAGDPLPGVDVLLEQIPGGQVYKAKLDADGNMIFNDLPPGEYRVYQEFKKPEITVSGPATFTPSDGDDIGTLSVSSMAPIRIDKLTARTVLG